MTQLKDPYPETLDDIPFTPIEQTLEPLALDAYATALNRIAAALEQIAANRSQPVQNAPQEARNILGGLSTLPPVQTAAANGVCPIHGTPWKVVPAGVSKKTGKPYEAFRACATAGCDQRPPR